MRWTVIIMSMILMIACNSDRYEALLQKELSSGHRVDSIFFGIYLGMTSEQFYKHCWEMNKKGLFTDGQNNTAVLYKLDNHELKYPASMNFYPEFHHDRVFKMKAIFNYDAWAPWNKAMSSDSLFADLLNLYTKWYPNGNPFIRIDHEKRGTIYVKLDGNRRIVIGKYDDMSIKADYTDLLKEQEIKNK